VKFVVLKHIRNFHCIMRYLSLSMVFTAVVCFSGCKSAGAEWPLVAGVLDGPLPADTAPAHVLAAIQGAERFHEHDILSDTLSNVAVFSLDEVDTTSTEGYGMVVMRGAISTTFPHIRNVRQPLARYDSKAQTLWLTSSAMEGTGVAVERLYAIRFHDNDSAYIAHTPAQPYDLQQQLCKRLGYAVNGARMTFYDGSDSIVTVTDTLTDMGPLDKEHPLWIGEQMVYDLSGDTPSLLVTPGVKYAAGGALAYDCMPTLSAPLTFGADGTISLGRLSAVEHPFEGDYLDEDNNEPNLHIHYNRGDGRYSVEIGIFRLTLLDDGIGTVDGDNLRFTATDAAGNPISGIISLQGDTAVVKFTGSRWDLLPNGSEFRYFRDRH